ncbi:MAG: hypothetical protein QW692_04505 [Nitrososphaerota archaeon]
MSEVGNAEFVIYDEWGRGLPLTDSMEAIIMSGMTLMSVMAMLRDLFEEVVK